jgi:hypothetical protein
MVHNFVYFLRNISITHKWYAGARCDIDLFLHSILVILQTLFDIFIALIKMYIYLILLSENFVGPWILLWTPSFAHFRGPHGPKIWKLIASGLTSKMAAQASDCVKIQNHCSSEPLDGMKPDSPLVSPLPKSCSLNTSTHLNGCHGRLCKLI